MKPALLIAALFCLLYGATCRAGQPDTDPLVGRWIWQGDHIAEFHADGTITSEWGWKGTWQYLSNPEVQRKYRFVWEDGKAIDKAVLAENGKTISVQNNKNERFTGRRTVSTP